LKIKKTPVKLNSAVLWNGRVAISSTQLLDSYIPPMTTDVDELLIANRWTN